MIYVIDDDKFVLRGLGMLLRSADFKFMTFERAERFLETYEPGTDDLLILDMHMPGLNGCDVLQHLNYREIYLPTIIITAFDEQSSRDCAKNFGAVAYLRKPIDGEALIDVIRYHQYCLKG